MRRDGRSGGDRFTTAAAAAGRRRRPDILTQRGAEMRCVYRALTSLRRPVCSVHGGERRRTDRRWTLGQYCDTAAGVFTFHSFLPESLQIALKTFLWRFTMRRSGTLENVKRNAILPKYVRKSGSIYEGAPRWQCRINHGAGGAHAPGPLSSGASKFFKVIIFYTYEIYQKSKMKTLHTILIL